MFKKFYPYEYVESVFMIDFEKLYLKGYRALIFDIDNTLVHHGDDSTPEVDSLFQKVQAIGFKTLLLTDNDDARVQRFIKNIDTMYICRAGKPDTAGYKKAIGMLGEEKKRIVCIGDQIFKDILGANQSGMASILVKFIRLETETKIGKRRYLEKLLLWFYRHNRSAVHRLGDIQKEKEN